MDVNHRQVVDCTDAFLLFTKEMLAEALGQSGFELLHYWSLFKPDTTPTKDDWKVSVVARRK